MRFPFILTCLLALFTGCIKDNVTKGEKQDFVDLTGFLNEQKRELTVRNLNFEKTIVLNGKEEKKVLDRLVWNNELNPFYECDLNETAMINDYHIDSLQQGDTTSISYSPIGEGGKVKKMDITLYNNSIQSVRISTSINNAWFTLERELYYQKNQGYFIAESRRMALTGRDSLNIRVVFLP